ncbi:AAA-like domain-containing protein [Calothrix sp. 336/3]|uniref:AAA-like domain-containing protein n=1 Tax=Calothrix sp. 336/3 TaxID=1337936 RepID=UPI0004E349EB|nr:AAA-like domain-containing protein [Calothrix sp. 336/3]AKG22639.1 hypothetical protein IJ00_16380 [Calothrix sp. 336/3]
MTSFNLDTALKIANQLTHQKHQRNLTDVEIIILKGAWERQDYDQIAAQNQYATSYISQDVAPKLWKSLTEALGEKVRKSNFKEALKRSWENYLGSKNGNLIVTEVSAKIPILDTGEQDRDFDDDLEDEQTSLDEVYVERPPIESIAYETLLQPGSLLRVKAPKLMGKSYLVNRLLSQIKQQNYRIAILSFELAERNIHFTDLNKFLRWFCLNLSRELKLPNELDEYWDEAGMGAKVSCTTYFEECLLSSADTPLVICLDDVDLLFPYPHIYEDFFGLLRSWYEKARSRKIWKKLRLIIVHSTDVYIRLNINQSPFNVGLPIELSEFTYEQVVQFAQKYELTVNPEMLQRLMQLIGGHPYLLELTFLHLQSNADTSIDQIVSEAIADGGIYGHHLREYWLDLHLSAELEAAFQKVVAATEPLPLPPILAYQLNSMGLVKISGNSVQPRCNLYRYYFPMYWGNQV